MRRRVPWWLLVVAFVAMPLVEIYVIVQIGQVVGPWWTIGLLLLSAIVGGWLVKREGAQAWRALTAALQSGRMPARELADGALIVVGGALMLTPGFVTDIVGMLVVLPFTRPLARRALTRVIARRVTMRGGPYAGGPYAGGPSAGTPFPGGPFPGGPGPEGPARDGRTARRPGPDVVQGDVVDP